MSHAYYQQRYLDNLKKHVARYDTKKFEERGGEQNKKQLAFFEGVKNQVQGLAEQVMAQGYDTNTITTLEELLANFQAMYNQYAFDIVRKPSSGLSQYMREIIAQMNETIQRIAEHSPHYANRLAEHIRALEAMNVRTGGQMVGQMVGGQAGDNRMIGGSLGRYTGQIPIDVDVYEPTILERMAMQQNIQRYPNYEYSKMPFNEDYN